MSELALTLLRLGFLGLLWLFVVLTVLALRTDLRQPRDLRPAGPVLPTARPTIRAARGTRAKGTSLEVLDGILAGTIIPLGTTTITVGRSPDSTLVIDDDYTSSKHARFVRSDGEWLVEDLGSTNGTWLDRARITGPTVVPMGVPVRIGRTTLVLRK